jgi:integrase/recombinase XerD
MGVQRILLDGQRTWTVTGNDHLPVGPVEEYLEFLRAGQQCSPNTVRSYATSLARWWEYLTTAGTAWDEVGLPFFVSFVSSLRTGLPAGVAPLPAAEAAGGPSESTIAARVTAVLSFYRYHADVHQVPVAGRLYRVGGGRAGRYSPGLVHLQRGRQQPVPAVRVRRGAVRPVPLLTPAQVDAILDQCARKDPGTGQWSGQVRDRLLFAALAETGMRLGELLSTRHCDWHAGRGGTPFIEVIPRQDHPAGVRCKSSRCRRIYISDELERLHSEYVWQLCDAGAHQEVDLAGHFVLVNLSRGQWLAPMRPETVYDKVASLKRSLGNAVPAAWTPHWFRHTHASALKARSCIRCNIPPFV